MDRNNTEEEGEERNTDTHNKKKKLTRIYTKEGPRALFNIWAESRPLSDFELLTNTKGICIGPNQTKFGEFIGPVRLFVRN